MEEVQRLSPRGLAEATVTPTVGSDAATYDLSQLDDWDSDASQVRRLEIAYGYGVRTWVPPGLWVVRDDTLYIDLAGYDINEGVRVEYTAPHSVNTTTGTTTFTDREGQAAAYLAAAELLEKWAARWVQQASGIVAAETFEGPSPADAMTLANEYRQNAQRRLKRGTLLFGADAARAVEVV